MEICGGHGELAARYAKAEPQCRGIVTDLDVPDYPENQIDFKRLPNLFYRQASAFHLSFLEPESVDLIWGQASLHHLAHVLADLCRKTLRVLKPGGGLVFILEPFGRKWLVVTIKAICMLAHEAGDQSSLYSSPSSKRWPRLFPYVKFQHLICAGIHSKHFLAVEGL